MKKCGIVLLFLAITATASGAFANQCVCKRRANQIEGGVFYLTKADGEGNDKRLMQFPYRDPSDRKTAEENCERARVSHVDCQK